MNTGQPKVCRACSGCFSKLPKINQLLLHWHNKLDHMNMENMRNLVRVDFLSKELVKADKINCVIYQNK